MFDYGFAKFKSKQDLIDKAIRFWNPDKTQVLAEGRDRSRDRQARGLLPLRHVGTPADRPAPQWRHLQSGPSPPRTGADAEGRARPFRHRQPLVPLDRADGAGRGADQSLAGHEVCRLCAGRRRGRRHRHQERPLRHQAAQDRVDRQGLSRTFGAGGGDRRRPLHENLSQSDQPETFVQVPFNDIDAMEQALRGQRCRGADHRDDPRDLRLPDAEGRLSQGLQGAMQEAWRDVHCRRGADRPDAHRQHVGLAGLWRAARHHGHGQGTVRRALSDQRDAGERARPAAGSTRTAPPISRPPAAPSSAASSRTRSSRCCSGRRS